MHTLILGMQLGQTTSDLTCDLSCAGIGACSSRAAAQDPDPPLGFAQPRAHTQALPREPAHSHGTLTGPSYPAR